MKAIRYLTLGMILAGSPVAFSADNDAMNLEKMLHDMDAHWQQVISEKDVKRRQAMLSEHEKMMKDVEATTDGMSHGSHGMMHQHSTNILEMHRAMMGSVK